MSLKPEPRENDEVIFASELGWFATLSVAICAIAVSVF